MAVPPQDELHRPLLEIAAESGDVLSKKQFLEAITFRLSLTPEDLNEKVSSGNSRVRVNRDFALYKLRIAGLLHRPSRAQFQMTHAGREYVKAHSGKITTADLSKLAGQQEFTDNNSAPSILTSPSPIGAPDDDSSPQDKMDAAYLAIQEQLAVDLLDTISKIPPEGFEQLVLDLLQKMGYGKGQVVGRSGDGGIDGVIDQDALGLEKVYIQAKRWKNQVGEPEIRNFSGSLDPKGATKGVFVTTSRFNEKAKQSAEDISKGSKFIRLIDGRELAQLMMDYNVGVVTQYAYKIQELDENYFIDVDPDFLDRDSYLLDQYADSQRLQ